jgi:hypothetical protein
MSIDRKQHSEHALTRRAAVVWRMWLQWLPAVRQQFFDLSAPAMIYRSRAAERLIRPVAVNYAAFAVIGLRYLSGSNDQFYPFELSALTGNNAQLSSHLK